jgi:prevent-host-death family protein
MTVAAARNQFSDVLRRAQYGGERVVVERRGKPVAAVVSTDDLRRLEALEESADTRDAAAALKEAEEQGTIPLEVVLHRHGLDHLLVQRRARSAVRKEETAIRRAARRKPAGARRKTHRRG